MLPPTPGAASPARSQALTTWPSPSLHLAPSGDFWIGRALYAAKHNPSDYVRSLPLPIGQIIPDDCPHGACMYDSKEVDVGELRPAWPATHIQSATGHASSMMNPATAP